jgi:thiamine-phosphate pyrophosphorylase
MDSARATPPRLLALSPGDLDGDRCAPFVTRVARAAEAGLKGVLLREPGLGDRATLELARALAERVPWLGLHDRAHLAAAAGARAVHLGFRSLRPSEVRNWLADDVAIGLSTHAADDPATWGGTDYLFHGPIFDTPSKAGLLEAIGCAGLARGVRAAPAPVWALGGLRPEHAASVLATGARGLCVRAGILGQRDPAAAVSAWLAALQSVPEEQRP